ncbi:hypothetical protein KS4_32380 [Poriferisphaera corsica]|uniref:Uncharacterized protein n=1 Tax=Poriferisphaera corsica TaxID=2528020 RepID=A0A517YY58_9BACT|nr:hypothetical protein [Poriferisphaera corsica]QDU35158.1 hypothetical protein KS4_32380 [Poriferisphaera corsica]
MQTDRTIHASGQYDLVDYINYELGKESNTVLNSLTFMVFALIIVDAFFMISLAIMTGVIGLLLAIMLIPFEVLVVILLKKYLIRSAFQSDVWWTQAFEFELDHEQITQVLATGERREFIRDSLSKAMCTSQKIVLNYSEGQTLILHRRFFTCDEDYHETLRIIIQTIGRCLSCNYKLRNSFHDTCPECGRIAINDIQNSQYGIHYSNY